MGEHTISVLQPVPAQRSKVAQICRVHLSRQVFPGVLLWYFLGSCTDTEVFGDKVNKTQNYHQEHIEIPFSSPISTYLYRHAKKTAFLNRGISIRFLERMRLRKIHTLPLMIWSLP